MKKKHLIGEFSKITGISKRMLRHYDKINLFSPIEINEENGYRYYCENQIPEIHKIQFLKKFGFTLSLICEISAKPIELSEFVEILKNKEVSLTKDADDTKSSLLMTKRLILLLEQSPNTFSSTQKLLDWERSITMISKKESTVNTLVNLKELISRDLFMERIEEILEMDNNNNYHFITFDIDNFMHVNDFDGYEVGDLVIQNIFTIIINNINPLINESPNNNLLTRLGGDECSIFLKDSNTEKVIKNVEKAFKEIRLFDFSKIGCSTKVTVSCGIVFGKKPKHIAEFKDRSIKALIEAKRNGRNQYIFYN